MTVKQITTEPAAITAAGESGLHILYNDSDVVIYLGLDGDAAVTTSTGLPLNPGERLFWEPGRGVDPIIYAVHGDSGNKALRYGRV